MKTMLRSLAVCTPFLIYASNSQGAVLTPGDMQDWGGSFQGSYTYTVEASDTINGVLSSWSIELQQPSGASINSAWVSGYNGGVDTSATVDAFTISNANQGWQPELSAGSEFTIYVQGSKPADLVLDQASFSVSFSSLDEPPVAVAEVETGAAAINVNDWYNPQWGGGFNATFECALAATSISNVVIDITYVGDGIVQNTSLQNYLGATTSVLSSGNNTVISTADLPGGTNTAQFQVSVNGAGYAAEDFDITCTSGDGIEDDLEEEEQLACELPEFTTWFNEAVENIQPGVADGIISNELVVKTDNNRTCTVGFEFSEEHLSQNFCPSPVAPFFTLDVNRYDGPYYGRVGYDPGELTESSSWCVIGDLFWYRINSSSQYSVSPEVASCAAALGCEFLPSLPIQ